MSIPSEVVWAYSAIGVVFAVGIVAIFLRGEWKKARGLDKLLLFGPLFYAGPLAAFGTEHFTLNQVIASIVPSWIPWHTFWAYFVGVCFIAAALSLASGICARLAATLVAVTFFLFVVLMDVPAWVQDPGDRFGLALALRELSFAGGALAWAASLGERGKRALTATARCFIAVPVLFYGFEQFLHAEYVPAIPLDRLLPAYCYGGPIWSYLTASVYAVAGALLLVGKKSRAAATCIGLCVLFIELAVYVPIGIMDRASLADGLNYVADTLMFCGAVLMLASALPREARPFQT